MSMSKKYEGDGYTVIVTDDVPKTLAGLASPGVTIKVVKPDEVTIDGKTYVFAVSLQAALDRSPAVTLRNGLRVYTGGAPVAVEDVTYTVRGLFGPNTWTFRAPKDAPDAFLVMRAEEVVPKGVETVRVFRANGTLAVPDTAIWPNGKVTRHTATDTNGRCFTYDVVKGNHPDLRAQHLFFTAYKYDGAITVRPAW